MKLTAGVHRSLTPWFKYHKQVMKMTVAERRVIYAKTKRRYIARFKRLILRTLNESKWTVSEIKAWLETPHAKLKGLAPKDCLHRTSCSPTARTVYRQLCKELHKAPAKSEPRLKPPTPVTYED